MSRPGFGFLLALTIAACTAVAEPMPARGVVEALFTPWDDAEGRLIRVVAAAKKTIHVQAYLFTSRPLSRALIEAHGRGVRVRVLADRDMALKGDNSQIPVLAAAGIPVWLETGYAAAHNKIIVIDAQDMDDCIVATGSFNFTYSAQARNAENLLLLRGNAPLAHAYLNNWQRHREDALSYPEALLP